MTVNPKPTRRPLPVLRRPEQFQRVLAQPWLAKTPHFAVHHLPAVLPDDPHKPSAAQLSSAPSESDAQPVDNFLEKAVDKSVDSTAWCPGLTAWAGFVVPKRHARRAVTRNLIRRQMRQVLLERQADRGDLPAGVWVLRLRAGFDRADYPSATSEPLRRAARTELQALVQNALRRLQGTARP